MEVEPEEFVMVLRFTCGEVDLVQQVDGAADGVAALRNERHTAIIAIALRRRKGCCSHGGVGWLATTVTAIQFDESCIEVVVVFATFACTVVTAAAAAAAAARSTRRVTAAVVGGVG